MSSTAVRKRWAPVTEEGVIAFRPVAHYMHPDDLRTALCGAAILGIPSFEPFEICTACKIHFAAQDWAPLPRSS